MVIMKGPSRLLIGVLALALSIPAAAAAQSNARIDYLLGLLKNSAAFRVRAQAALSLARFSPAESRVVKALIRALKDKYPIVRASAASALGKIGNEEAVAALKKTTKDPDETVRVAVRQAIDRLSSNIAQKPSSEQPSLKGARFAVFIEEPHSNKDVEQALLAEVHGRIRQDVEAIPGVVIGEKKSDVEAALKRPKIIGYYLRNTVIKLLIKPEGAVRAEVSVIVMSYPEQAMRMILSGAATVSGAGTGREAQLTALNSAFQSALRRLGPALSATNS